MSAICSFKASLAEKDTDQCWQLKWRSDHQYLRLKNNNGQELHVWLDDILDIRRHNDQLVLIAYPLINDKREQKFFVGRSDSLDQLEQALQKACVPQTPRKLFNLTWARTLNLSAPTISKSN